MRCLPVALTYWNASSETLRAASRTQSHVTHHSPIADAGTEAVLQMLVSAFRGESKTRLREIAEDLGVRHKAYRFHKRIIENPSGWIVETLKAVFQALFAHDSFEAILIDVVNRGGDADTTGAIAGMLAGACYGTTAIPKQWLKSLDQEVKRRCEEQTMQLLALAMKRV
jgi:ADP-ribosyl-[dinitrogen reductase] hydrolase